METFSSRLNSSFSEVSQAMKITGMRRRETIYDYLNEKLPHFEHDPSLATEASCVALMENPTTTPELYADYLTLSVGRDPAIPIPTYFDLHLEPDLRLNYVKPFPHLPLMLGKLLADNLENHPLNELEFDTSEHYLSGSFRAMARVEVADTIMADEASIPKAMKYWEYTAANVAACIYTHSEEWKDETCLEWHQDKSGKPQAFVAVRPEFAEDNRATSPEPLSFSSSLASKLQGIFDGGLSNVVVFDFKKIGLPFSADLFRAVQAVANGQMQFMWTACTMPGCCPNCRIPGSDKATLSGHSTGPDGVGVTHILDQLEEVAHPRVDHTTNSAHIMPGMINKAFFLLQELWSLAVKADATFVVLSSGEEEVIGIRHRDNQALYLSETLYVPREMDTCSEATGDILPTHLRVRCAMHMWALHDAIERAILISNLELPDRFFRMYQADGLSY